MYDVLLWLHIGAMMVAFATLPVAGVLLRIGMLSAQEPSLPPSLFRLFEPAFKIGGVAVALGVAAGLTLARNISFGEPWLVTSYVLTVIAALLGIFVDNRWARRMAAEHAGTLSEARGEVLPAVAAIIGPCLWLMILWLMVAKPALT